MPKAVLFGKVIAYECTACGRSFTMSLLYGAVPSDIPAPLAVRDSFLRHVCEEKRSDHGSRFSMQSMQIACLEFLMAVSDDDDFPVSYLFYIIAVIAVIGFLIIGGFFLWFR